MNLFQPCTSPVDGCSFEAILYATIGEKRHQVIIMRAPEEELFSNSQKYKDVIQCELYLLEAGNHICYFYGNDMQIIPDVYYLSKVADEGRDFKKMILQFIKDGKITLPNFITIVVTRFCEMNGAQMLISKPKSLTYFNKSNFLFAGKNK